MATIAPKEIRIGSADLEAVLAEAAGFAPEKFVGFEALVRRIGANAGERLGLDGAFDFEVSYSDAEAMSTELVFSAGLEKNVNFGLKLAPFAVPGMISIARPVLYGWLEYVLGGSRNEEIVYPERSPTNLELRIGQLFCRYLCDALFSAFDNFPGTASAEIILPDPETGTGRWVRRDAQFAVFYEASLGSISGSIVLLLPIRILDALRMAHKEPETGSEQLPDPKWGSQLAKAVNTTQLDMVAVLGRRQMTLEDVARLEVGQLVGLEAGAREPVVVEAGDRPVFSALLGRTNGRYTLKFEQMLDTEDRDGLPS